MDDDYKDGVGKCIALDLSNDTGAKLEVLGLDDRTAGFDKKVDIDAEFVHIREFWDALSLEPRSWG